MKGQSTPAVVAGVLQHVSASQIKLFRECARLWYEDKVLGKTEFISRAMQDGSKIHDYIEAEIREERGEPKLAAKELSETVLKSIHAARNQVPTGGHPEFAIYGTLKLAEVPVRGFIDYYLPEMALAVDWKSTSDFANVKSLAAATRDEQTVIYLMFTLLSCRTASAEMRYVYINTKKPAALALPVVHTRASLEPLWQSLEDTVKLMKAAAAAKTINDVQCGCRRCVMPMKAEKLKDLELLIDAVDLNGSGYQLETVIEDMAKVICKTEGVDDLRLVPYGKGPGMLAAAIRAAPPSGTIVCRRGPLANAAIEALIPFATRIIQGIGS